MTGNKYRYVGMRFPNGPGGITRGGASQFDIYTKNENLQYDTDLSVSYTRNNTEFIANIINLPQNSEYMFIAAGYDGAGLLADIKIAVISATDVSDLSAVTAKVDFKDSPNEGKIKSVKTMLWDKKMSTETKAGEFSYR